MSHRVKGLPTAVKVGISTYEIALLDKPISDQIGIYGDCSAQDRLIRIADVQPEAKHAAMVVIHEILHACFRERSIPDDADEETVVTQLAPAIVGVLADNPDLVRWLLKTAK